MVDDDVFFLGLLMAQVSVASEGKPANKKGDKPFSLSP